MSYLRWNEHWDKLRGGKSLPHKFRNPHNIRTGIDIIIIILYLSNILFLLWVPLSDTLSGEQMKSVSHSRPRKVLFTRTLAAAMQIRAHITLQNFRDENETHFIADISKSTKAKQQKNVHIFSQSFSALHISPLCIYHTKAFWNIHKVIYSALKCRGKVFRQNDMIHASIPTHPWKVAKKGAEKSIIFCVFHKLSRASCREWTGRVSNARIVRSAYLISRQDGRERKNRHSKVQPRVSMCTDVVQLDESQRESLNQFYSSTVNEQPLSSSSSIPIQK